MKSRIFNIMQYEKHPETGETLLTEEKIKDALSHRTIKRWAYICHDEDVYSALDEEQNPEHKKGNVKPRHWHIVIEMGSNQVEITVIAKWFGIADNFVNVAKGHGAFLDCCQYLTHEDDKQQHMGKRLYDDSRVQANFEFRAALDKRAEQKLKYGREVSEKDELRHRVLFEGMTIRQVCEEDPIAYQNDYSTLDKFRLKYITEKAPMPEMRINYYVCGSGGVGKGLICKAIARALYPNLKNDDDIFFNVGAKGSAFEGYDGQPVLIWDDRRGIDLLQELGGRGNVFNVFDMHPSRQRQNIKFSSVCLCNTINLINSVQPYQEFMQEIIGEYKDKHGRVIKSEEDEKGQILRRFPFIIPLHEADFDIMMNKGVFEGTREYDQYITLRNVQGSMKQIAIMCQGNHEAERLIQGQTVQPIIEQHNRLSEKVKGETPDTAALLEQFKDYGTMKDEKSKQPPGQLGQPEQPRQMELDEVLEQFNKVQN